MNEMLNRLGMNAKAAETEMRNLSTNKKNEVLLDESLGRKATGPVKWQPVARNEVHCLFGSAFLW